MKQIILDAGADIKSVPAFFMEDKYMDFENNETEEEYYEPNFYDSDYRPQNHKNKATLMLFKKPVRVFEYLDLCVYGHTEYKKALSLFIWKHVKGHKNGALLVAGESGTGKTEMIRALKKVFSNIFICDGASIVPAGYKGNTQLSAQLESLDFLDKNCPPVLVIDEFDKLCARGKTSWSDSGLIPELLKFIEGCNYNIGTQDKPRYIDTNKLGVILLGSFSALTDIKPSRPIGFNADSDSNTTNCTPLTKNRIMEGLPPELQGRISQVVVLNPFGEQDYYNILKDERYSPITRLSREFNLNLSISKKKYREIAHDAYQSRTGVRRMNNTVSAYLDEQLFSDPEIKEITIK